MLSQPTESNKKQQYLVTSFVEETRVLGFSSEGVLEEVELEGIDSAQQTILCCDADFNQVIQVTPRSVRLLGKDTKLVAEWSHETDLVTLASANRSQVCCLFVRFLTFLSNSFSCFFGIAFRLR